MAGRWQGNKAVWIAPEEAGGALIPVSGRLRSSARHSRQGSDRMSEFLGPLDSDGRVPPASADARRRVPDLRPWRAGAAVRVHPPLQLECRLANRIERTALPGTEIVSLLMRATSWVPDFALGLSGLRPGRRTWLPTAGRRDRGSTPGIGGRSRGARHMPCMPASVRQPCCRWRSMPTIPLPWRLRRIEFESGRLLQAQIILLKGPNLLPFRDAVSAALERRHVEVRKFWAEALRRRRHRRSTIGSR